MLIKKIPWNQLKDDNHNLECPVCGEKIEKEAEDVEYCRTKRGSHIFFHTNCYKKWGK